MTTMREQIVVAVVAKLAALTGVTVVREPVSDVDEEQGDCIAVFAGGHRRSDDAYGTSRYDMDVMLDFFSFGSSDTDRGSRINVLYGRVMALLLPDPSLGGLIIDLTEESFDVPDFDLISGQLPYAAARLNMTASFLTKSSDVSTPGP